MEPPELHERLDAVQVLDVREPWEWQEGHIAGSLHVPLAELPDGLERIAADRPVAVVCRSGARSHHATQWLRAHGRDAHNLEGGLEDWEAHGFELTAPDGSPGVVA